MTEPPASPPPHASETDTPVTRRATLAWVALVACVLIGVALYVAYGRDLLPLTTDVP